MDLGGFVAAHGPALTLWASRLTKNDDAGAELFALASARALTAALDFSQPARVLSWFYLVMKRAHIDDVLWREKRQTLDLILNDEGLTLCDTLAAPEDVAGGVHGEIERSRAYHETHRILRAMNPQMAGVLFHIDMDGLDYDEAARVMGVPLGTVRSRINRARADFKKRWDRRAGTPQC